MLRSAAGATRARATATTITSSGIYASDISIEGVANVCIETQIPLRSLPATIKPYDRGLRMIAKITTLRYEYSASMRQRV
ncbi:MAG TPA: hypothetical protein VGR40_11085, partial [Candidatus Binatus sp.]|nr:hypothetical protein [Candidatus Binatus sp.]